MAKWTAVMCALACAAALGAAAREEESPAGRRGAARKRPWRGQRPEAPRLTGYSDFLEALDDKDGDVAAVQLGPLSVRYTVGGEARECAALPAGTPWGLVQALRSARVDFEARDLPAPTEGGPRPLALLARAAPAALILGLLAAEALRQMLLSRRTRPAGPPADGFAAVAGLEGATAELAEMVDMLLAPGKFEALGIRPARGVLLVGPPGTGKTLLARAVAAEAGVRFYSRAGPEFHSRWIGMGAQSVRELFARARDARARTPAVIFIDEIDTLGAARGGSGFAAAAHREYDDTLNQLLACMDGAAQAAGGRPVPPGERVLVIAATNRYGVLDAALTRPGRFDRVIHVRLPGARARERILRLHSARIVAPIEADLGAVARRARGMSGAQLAALVNEAAVRAYRRGGVGASVGEEDFAGALGAVSRPEGQAHV